MSDSTYHYCSLSLSPSSQSVPSSYSNSLQTSPFSSLPFHNISWSISSTALDTEHFLKSYLWWGALPCCCDPHWLNNTLVFLGVQTYTNPWRFTVFSAVGVSDVKNLNTCVLDFSVMSALSVVFKLLIGPAFNFEPCSLFWPPLWSSGQSFWLQIQRSRVRFPALPDFLSSSGSGTGSTRPREVNWGATWIKSSGSGSENRD